MAQPSGAQRVPVVEAEAPAAPPRGKLVLRRQQTREGAAALLGLAARAPAAAPPADATESLQPYEGNDDCTVVALRVMDAERAAAQKSGASTKFRFEP